jgi:CheY-like chemotaxis protein
MPSRRVVSVVPDLFFATRIRATAQQLGVALEDASVERALDLIRETRPDLVVLDLHASGEPLALARALKADASTASVPIAGFYSHVEHAMRAAAIEAGVDHVLPRSAFTARLAALLDGTR